MDLTDMEQDALKEFFNMGLGMAADSLSQMVKKEIFLSLPQLAVVTHKQAIELVNNQDEGKLVAVRQNFLGELEGTALLIFPGGKGLELVRTLLGENIPLESLTELEQETLLDVGNVILNAFLSSFTQMMTIDFEFEAAEFLKADCEALLAMNSHRLVRSAKPDNKDDEEQAFFLMMDFKTEEDEHRHSSLRGYVVLLFSREAMATLRKELQRILTTL
ncbi:MAG: chemotaxis protein CheC [Candidatus Magnetobacterium sp. LHC-1]|uniref:Chemotaxis protein CheC n=1 Tax=Candidatus Magnetobacterium casense TaxID=1455061 RepID=A0ABS6S3F6_9BACT|nr:chemotaxis protein CheC [Candidatus Magnetobacterium casensis]MBF0606576.1 chemotaxis protein CheC [Nitrospirota bacterium]MBV6342909.1 chemotaxis protein CheC [Candidatus Magnetobacterium casensis]